MDKIKNIIRKFKLNVSQIETVPESFSSDVNCKLKMEV